jgi:hypothetical protein
MDRGQLSLCERQVLSVRSVADRPSLFLGWPTVHEFSGIAPCIV